MNKKLNSLKDVQTRIVINCAGLGAKELVKDSTLQPVLGNVLNMNNDKSDKLNYMILTKSERHDLILYFPKVTDARMF